jgi:hypothetical protein
LIVSGVSAAAKLDAASIIAKNRPERMRDPKAAGGFFKAVATLFVEHPAAMAIAAARLAPRPSSGHLIGHSPSRIIDDMCSVKWCSLI